LPYPANYRNLEGESVATPKEFEACRDVPSPFIPLSQLPASTGFEHLLTFILPEQS
jgi:hypothetical protein